jgi:hypothetical protein
MFGYRDGVPNETKWWPRQFAEASVSAVLSGEQVATAAAADALVNGVALRTFGLLAYWQQRLGAYPEALAAACGRR